MPDPLGLVLAVGFIAGGLALIPLNDWLDKRRQRRRNQAHETRP